MMDQPKLQEDDLLGFLRESLLRGDPGEKSVRALLSHLADLGFLSPCEDNQWQIEGVNFEDSEKTWREEWIEGLRSLCENPRGFALKYFIRELPETVSLAYPDPAGFQGTISEGVLEKDGSGKDKASSNISNLQIVKKVGRQLSPLIEMENDFLGRLEGKHTDRQRARHIFNFIISQVKMKGEPREWVQLSRRRHK